MKTMSSSEDAYKAKRNLPWHLHPIHLECFQNLQNSHASSEQFIIDETKINEFDEMLWMNFRIH